MGTSSHFSGYPLDILHVALNVAFPSLGAALLVVAGHGPAVLWQIHSKAAETTYCQAGYGWTDGEPGTWWDLWWLVQVFRNLPSFLNHCHLFSLFGHTKSWIFFCCLCLMPRLVRPQPCCGSLRRELKSSTGGSAISWSMSLSSCIVLRFASKWCFSRNTTAISIWASFAACIPQHK